MSVFISEGSRSMARNLNDLMERWKLRREIENPKPSELKKIVPVEVEQKVDLPAFFTAEEIVPALEAMTIKDLNDLEADALKQVNDIKFQVSTYTARLQGFPLDMRWIVEANHIRARLNELTRTIGRVRSAKKKSVWTKTRGFADIFLEEARKKLPPEIFDQIDSESRRIYNAIFDELIDAKGD